MQRFSIRSGKGLGDSLYLQGVARHLVEKGQQLEVCTSWPDVFRPLASRVEVSPFRRDRVDRVAHYISRKRAAGTDQFTDCCISTGITEKVEFRLDWKLVNPGLVEVLGRGRRPVILVQMPRSPMDRADGYGMDLLPDCLTIQRAIDALRSRGAYIVQIGRGAPLHHFRNLDLDLANTTNVAEAIDLASLCDGVLGYCSFIAPLAECLGKPALLVWSSKGLKSSNEFIRQIVPAKIFNKPTSRALMDDCTPEKLSREVDALFEQIGSPALV